MNEIDRLLMGYMSPVDRHYLERYHYPYGQNQTAKLLRELSYFEKIVLPELILPLKGVDVYHERLLERVKAILFDVAHRLDPDGGYDIERKKYRKTMPSRDLLGVSDNYWSRSRDYVEIWLGSKRSLMVRLLKGQYKGYFSPEASRFIARRLFMIAGRL